MALDTARLKALDAFQAQLGIPFRDLELLDEALTHSSYVNESAEGRAHDNQRLEYLGDAILGFLVGEWLYNTYPRAQEGELTALRALIVRTESVAELGRRMGIGYHLSMGRGESSTGGQDRDANLCAAVEALIGALYLDHGLGVTRAFVYAFMEERASEIGPVQAKDAKSYLQEHVQSTLHETPQYRIVSEDGPDHAKVFTAAVLVNQQVWGQGTGSSKQAAQQAAAQAAIEQLGF